MTAHSTLHDTEPASVEMPAASTLALHSEAMAHKPDPLACAYRRIMTMNKCHGCHQDLEPLAAIRTYHAGCDPYGRIERLEAALKFYADRENWKADYCYATKGALADCGTVARAALAKDSGGKG